MTMKPFDLEAAKRGEPIQCCGMSAKFIAYEPEAVPYERVICMGHGNNIFLTDKNGNCPQHKLTMAPKKRTVWVNLYQVFYTEEDADAADTISDRQRIGCKAYPVEIEE